MRISTWPQDIPIHNQILIERYGKWASCMCGFFILLMKRRLYIHSNKSSFKSEKDLFIKNIITGDEKRVFYDNIQCKRQWIDKNESLQPTPKKKSYAVCMVRLLQYYSFWLFQPQSDTQCRLILLTATMCTWKSKNISYIYQ